MWAIILKLAEWFLGKVLGTGVDAAKEAQARADWIAAGQAQQKNVDQAAAVQAGKVIQDAQAEPHGRAVTQAGLDNGKF